MNTNLNSFIKRNKRNIQNKKLNRHERFNTDYGLDAFNKAKNNEDPYFSSNKKLKILNKNSKLNTGGSLKVLLKVKEGAISEVSERITEIKSSKNELKTQRSDKIIFNVTPRDDLNTKKDHRIKLLPNKQKQDVDKPKNKIALSELMHKNLIADKSIKSTNDILNFFKGSNK